MKTKLHLYASRVTIRLSANDRNLLERAAAARGDAYRFEHYDGTPMLGRFIRDAALEAAVLVLAQTPDVESQTSVIAKVRHRGRSK